jgi:hypothetical protein
MSLKKIQEAIRIETIPFRCAMALTSDPEWAYFHAFGSASLAQLVEQLICNQQVVGSSPSAGLS